MFWSISEHGQYLPLRRQDGKTSIAAIPDTHLKHFLIYLRKRRKPIHYD